MLKPLADVVDDMPNLSCANAKAAPNLDHVADQTVSNLGHVAFGS